MMEFNLLSASEINAMWTMFLPGLRKDLSHKNYGLTEEKIFTNLKEKKWHLVIITSCSKYKGFVTMAYGWARPGYITLFNIFYDGRWATEDWIAFEMFCDTLHKDVRGINFLADRIGFVRRMKEVGYQQGSVELYKEF